MESVEQTRAASRKATIDAEIEKVTNELQSCAQQERGLQKLKAELAAKLVKLKGEQDALSFVLNGDNSGASDSAASV